MSDLISRAEAIEAVRKEYEDAINIGDNGEAIAYDVGRILSALPSADAVSRFHHDMEVKELKHQINDAVQGEWQKVEEQPYFRKHYDTVCCSVCRKKGNRKWNFCPSCGARMKGGDDE